MTRLGVALGANAATFAGLAGVGDLVLTCTGALSRNRALGIEIGKGASLETALAGKETVAEGVRHDGERAGARASSTTSICPSSRWCIEFSSRDTRRATRCPSSWRANFDRSKTCEPQPHRGRPVQEFFSIGEVCELTGLKPHVLRYWESQFRFLSPAKNRSGNRVYQRREVELIMLVKHLLYDEKYTIEGARQKVDEHRKGGDLEGRGARRARPFSRSSRSSPMLKELIGMLEPTRPRPD